MFVNIVFFFRQSFLRIWRAAEQPPAPGSDAGWSLDMPVTIFYGPRSILTDLWSTTHRHHR